MDILRNLFGNVTSGIIRLAVAAGILFCAYLFIVKPVLDTTNEAIRSSGLNQIGKTLQDLGPQIERQIKHRINRSLRISQQTGDTEKLIRCIKRAQPDVRRIERCTVKY
jgi:hypothetical protein